MNEQKPVLEKLPVLKDDPLFWGSEEFDRTQDAFNHEAYAKAIFDILAGNDPPLSIGLFGPWGIGKSTIISILFKLIKQSRDCKLKPLYFNAWKYSGDSFRRQLLIEIAKQVYEGHPDRETKVLRLEQLNYTDVFREEARKSLLEQVKKILSTRVKLREPGVARILLALVVLIVGAVLTAFDRTVYPLISSAFAAILLFFLRLKFEDVFVIQETPVYDPKLIFPEQFEAEFKKLISPSGPIGLLRPVVVIDDIDRCEADTIRNILISIKTFVGQENCFFIVPCDDRSIVQIFQEPNQRKGYEDELLRKFFNVAVRIAPLMGTDLVDFANSVSRRTSVPGSVVQIAILANYRDARKMKHFLNTFAVKYAIAKARQKSGFMPVDIDKNLSSFVKAVLVEDLFPDLFGKMVEHPEIYESIERAALGLGAEAVLNKFGLVNWERDYPGLKSILEKTRDIKIDHIEVFLSLKTTNPEARIPRGWELKNSVVEGDQVAIDEILNQVSTHSALSALRELLHDLLDKTTDTFLKNTITASLGCYFRENLVAAGDKPQLARDICYALVYREGQRALQQPAAQALQCASDAGNALLDRLCDKYENEIGELEQPPEGAVETINALFRFAMQRGPLSTILDRRFEVWASTDKGLSVIGSVELPTDLKDSERLPSLSVLNKIAASVSPEGTLAASNTNNLRGEIIFKYWDKKVAPTLAEKFVAILQQGQADKAVYTRRIAFVIRGIIANNECLELRHSPQIWAEIQELYGRLTEEAAKFEVHQATLVFAIRGPAAEQKQQAMNFASQNWATFTDSRLRATMTYLRSFGNQGQELQKSLVQQQLSAAQTEIQSPSDRTSERVALCYEYMHLMAARSLETLFLNAMETSDVAFVAWRVIIAEYCKKMQPEFVLEIADKCLALVSGSYSQPRRQEFFGLFATVVPLVGDDARPRLLQAYFALCKNADANLRNPASSILGNVRKAVVDEQDFKLGLNALVREVCRMTPAEVAGYRQVLDTAMEHSPLFGDYEWRDLGDLSKRSIQEVDASLQDYGLLLVERLTRIPADHDSDLIHLLVGIARGTNQAQRERADKVLRKISGSEPGAQARGALQDYLTPSNEEEKDRSS